MSDEVVLQEKIRLVGADLAEKALEGIGRAASRVAESFEKIGELAGAVTGLGGIFAVVEGVHEVDALYQAVGRVKSMTGLAAENAHAMFDMFELSGVEMEGAERIMISMARLSGKMGDGVSESAEQAQKLNSVMARIGVTAKTNIVDRLMQMSKAAQAGRLSVNDLVTAFGIRTSQAGRMMAMLKQGPERLKEIQKQTLAGADVIDDKTLESYENMLQMRRNLKDAWGDMIGVLYKGMIPAITSILQAIADGFRAIEPVVARIGKFLSENRDTVVSTMKSIAAMKAGLSIANLFRAEGAQKMGVFGLLKAGAGMMKSRAAVSLIAETAHPLAAGASGLPGIMTRVMGSSLGRIGLIGAAVAVAAAAFKLISSNALGIKDTFVSIGKRLYEVFKMVEPVLDMLASVFAVAVKGAAYLLVGALKVVGIVVESMLWAVKKIAELVEWILVNIPALASAGSGFGGKYADEVQAAQKSGALTAATKKAADTKDKEHAGTYQDFRGSTFNIEQKFAEGYDPGRVVVTFRQDLIAQGERPIDSALRPLYSYRGG